MINDPPVDLLIEKLSDGGEEISRYALCVVASKRARQIIEKEQSAPKALDEHVDKELSIAGREIASGKIKYVKD